jgi:8-oxo-dGTP diphosphatase
VYFAMYDRNARMVFIGHHKKSGLWLFTGGHVEKNELPDHAVTREIREELGVSIPRRRISPRHLLTITTINNPEKVICRKHYDIWHFIDVDRVAFRPSVTRMKKEFRSFGWKTFKQARALTTDTNTPIALRYIKTYLLS